MHATPHDLNLLHTFVAVAELASFTAAAQRLQIARPQVSLQIRRLEAALGTTLFTRTTRRVALTDAGQRLFEHGAPLLHDLQQALQQVGNEGTALRGRLRIAATVEHATRVLAPAVAAFATRHPEVRVDLLVSDRVHDLVAEGIDVAIRMGWMRATSARVARLGEFDQAVLASPAYLARHGQPKAPQDLADHRWIALNLLPAPLTWVFAQGAKTVTVRMTPRLRTDSAVALRALLVAGAGVSAGSLLHLQDAVRSGALVRLLPDWTLPRGGIYAVYPPGNQIAPAARAFVEMLRGGFEMGRGSGAVAAA